MDHLLALQIEHFAAVIRGDTKPLVSGRDGLQNLRVILNESVTVYLIEPHRGYAEAAAVQLRLHKVHPAWNYTISPTRQKQSRRKRN